MEMKETREQTVREYLSGLLVILGGQPQIEIRAADKKNELWIDLKGELLFDGQDQPTLKALAHLLEIFLKRKLKESIRIYIDVNSYKEKRKRELSELALKIADEVVRERKRIRLNPMAAYERKAIHEALSGFKGVRTYSEGQGDERRVIIEPGDTSLQPARQKSDPALT